MTTPIVTETRRNGNQVGKPTSAALLPIGVAVGSRVDAPAAAGPGSAAQTARRR
jgi:hypothetical protein